MEAKLKEKQAMSLVSGLQADIEALQAQVNDERPVRPDQTYSRLTRENFLCIVFVLKG